MRLGIAVLVLAYGLSQLYRFFLAVIAPELFADLGATPGDLSRASALWFVTFAAMQIPVGAALDRVGPRRTAAVLLALGGGGGAAVFALAQGPGWIAVAMMLIGIGCSPVLMASYYIFARTYPAAVFATLAGATIGLGSLGNVAGSAPMVWAAEALGWRGALWGLCGITLVVAALIALTVRDPEKVAGPERGSVLDILRLRVLWPIIPLLIVNYAPAAALRGLWAGPYSADVFALDAGGIGRVTLVMALAMIAGNFAYGPLDRLFGTRKGVILGGNLICAAACWTLFALPDTSLALSTALLAVIGATGASYPMMVAHFRAFVPPHLTGRGVTLANLFSIGGVGLAQFSTGPVHAAAGGGIAGYTALFALFGGLLLLGCLIYLAATDSTD